MSTKRTADVFGVSPTILPDSYIDRGELDSKIKLLLDRNQHIALRGESKSGKTWLRQNTIRDSIVVQCRLGKTITDIYVDALSQLDINFIVNKTTSGTINGKVEATVEAGKGLIAKVFGLSAKAGASTGGEYKTESQTQPVGHDINDLRHIAEIIIESGKKLVIEDFHYLSIAERRSFAFELKALYDYRCYVVIVGVWSSNNMLLSLNPDLSGRIEEVPIHWSESDLKRVIQKGSGALNITISGEITNSCIGDCYGNVGILQGLILKMLDECKIFERQDRLIAVNDAGALELATLQYADQLNPLYQSFAKTVSKGIRTRNDSTGIYAHAMAAILAATDANLYDGLHVDEIFNVISKREPRVLKHNLKTILCKIDGLQVDADGRGLVVSYDESREEVFVVDKQILLYRKYCTVRWPWEELIAECQAKNTTASGV